ncbi:hypothetical protein [Bifidobacterium asteroides]|uniref:hypothetical protein n=1 Tax=Bifidobacterium asteroides TaxID=1684 RepID=UPI003A7F998C
MTQQRSGSLGKKDVEQNHFQQALNLLDRSSAYGHAMVDRIFGPIVAAEESPDFILEMPSRPNTLIGVEHLHTDPSGHLYTNPRRPNKKPTYQSELKRIKSSQDTLQQEGKHIDWNDEKQESRVVKKLSELLTDDARMLSESDTSSQIQDLEFTLKHHLQKADSYRKTVTEYGRGMTPKHEYGGLAVYIDMQCDYSYLTINKPGKPPRKCRQGELPVFPEVVQMIRESAESHVRWILISASTMITDEMTSALLFDTTDIETSMRQQELEVCLRFTCQTHKPFDDQRPFVHTHDINDDKSIHFTLNKQQRAGTKRQLQRLAKEEVCKAIGALEHNQTFVTSPAVQLMLNIYGDYLLKYKQPGVPLNPGVMDRLLRLDKR